ncbi:hypothetical protein RFZ57_13970, partial [Acinetobacter baumannii]|nr:hypothetical protein [Acinetobacter baumannii]
HDGLQNRSSRFESLILCQDSKKAPFVELFLYLIDFIYKFVSRLSASKSLLIKIILHTDKSV